MAMVKKLLSARRRGSRGNPSPAESLNGEPSLQDGPSPADQPQDSVIEAAQQRETLHRQQPLQAKRIREELAEAEWRRIDAELAERQEQERRMVLEKAAALRFRESERVRQFHSAVQFAEVLRERDDQVELGRQKQIIADQEEKSFWAAAARIQEEEASRQQERAVRKEQERLALGETLKQQIKDRDGENARQKEERMKQPADFQPVKEFLEAEKSALLQKKEEQRRNMASGLQEQINYKDIIQQQEAQRELEEEKKRSRCLYVQEKRLKESREKEERILRDRQMRSEAVSDMLAAEHRQHEAELKRFEEAMVSKPAAQAEAEHARKQRQANEKRAAMWESIAEHRAAVQQRKQQQEQEEKRMAAAVLAANKEADSAFWEEQRLKEQKKKEQLRNLQDAHIYQMAEKREQQQRERREEKDFHNRNAERFAQEDAQFQEYAERVIQSVSADNKHTQPLHQAASKGAGTGVGPVIGSIPNYLNSRFKH